MENQITKRINGKFAPGHSGNPTGRPPVPKPIQEMLGGLVEPAVRAMAEALNGNDPRLKLVAAQEVLNRVYGKPVAPVEVKGLDASAAHIAALTALAAMAKVAPAGDVIDVEAEEIPALTHSDE